MADDDLPDVDELFALAPEEFTAARDALAKRLRAAKEREAATAVKALRRPTVVAWALNQLARRHRDVAEALVRSGEALADAQRAALAGEGGNLREATSQRSARVREATALAVQILGPRAGEAHRQDLAASLTAASSDPEAGAALLAGRLSEGLADPGGFTFGFGLDPSEAAGDVVDLGAPRADRAAKSAEAAQAAEADGTRAARGGAAKSAGARARRPTRDARSGGPAEAEGAEAARAEGTGASTTTKRTKGTKGTPAPSGSAAAARTEAEAAARRAVLEAARQAAAALREEADQARAAAEASRADADRAVQRVADLEQELAAARGAAEAAVGRAKGEDAAAAAAERAAEAARAAAERAR